MSDDLLTPSELAAMLGMSARTLANWRSNGKGPPYLKIGVEPPEGHQDRRKVRYQRQTAEQWALAHKYQRTVAR
nr:MAG TPA: helix-turn-helix domain protein [Caudoviricetes sp.]